MIKSFVCKDTEKIWNGEITRRWSLEPQNRAPVKLRLVDTAETFDDLKIPPGNRPEYLKGDRPKLAAIWDRVSPSLNKAEI